MTRTIRAGLVVLTVVAQMAIGVVISPPAHAGVGPADDRQLTTPTPWATYTGVTAAQLNNYLGANNARLTSLQVDSSAPTFTAVMVRNTGRYASESWWYRAKTEAQVNALLSTNHARPISMSAYSTDVGVRYAVVMVPNSGANAKTSWWYHDTAANISAKLTANNARPIEISPYPGGGYVAIMVDNTGSDATSWWWYDGIGASTVNANLSAHHARLIDVSHNTDGTYNVVMYPSTTRADWYQQLALSDAVATANQLGERIIDATGYVVGGIKYYAVVTIRNTNALSEKLWKIVAPKVDSGTYGFYLKQVGGPAPAELQSTLQYEPAGALEVLYHAKSIHEESLGNATDANVITYHYNNLADPNDKNICPDDFSHTTTTNLKNANTQLMQNSDNRMSRGIVEKYGKPAMLDYATSLGLTSTQINHNIGCPTSTTLNRTMLADLGKVYEAFQNGTVTSNATWITQFKSRMLNELNYSSAFKASICPIVQQEATALGKSEATATAFCDAMTWIAKGGSYQYGASLPYQVSWDGYSLTGVPSMSGGVTTPTFFVFGEFVDGTTIDSQAEANSINAARTKLYQEALRPYIRAALTTWA